MRRTLLIASTLLTVVLAAVGIMINLRCVGTEALAPPDPAMPITLFDGSQLPLGELLARVERNEPLPVQEPLADRFGIPALTPEEAAVPGAVEQAWARREMSPEELAAFTAMLQETVANARRGIGSRFGPVFSLADEHLRNGNLDQAEALYLSIPEDHPGYAIARRRLAWDILSEGRGQPERGVDYVHEALLAEPMNDSSWQDLARVYGSTLGFDMD
jgi:hypothetical protein